MSMDHEEYVVIPDEPEPTEMTPEWASMFRVIVEHLRQEGHLEALEEMSGAERRADSYELIDIVLFLVAYFCANRPEGGLRAFYEDNRKFNGHLAALAGRRALPGSASVSRFLKQVDAEEVERFRRWALGEATGLGALAARSEAMWQDTTGQPWLVADWDPKARLIRQRTLPDGEEEEPKRRFGPEFGEPGRVGRKRGELKFVRGLVGHAGTGQWLGAYWQSGNGELIEEMQMLRQVREALDEQLGDRLEETPVMRVDGEGGEVAVLNGLRDTGWCPLVRLKQYSLLERRDVRRAIEQGEPTVAEGTGTGPKREVFEIGEVPLTSNRAVEEVHRWDEALWIRLVVSRYEQTEADQGPGKLIDGKRYEMFGTDLPAERWPEDAVVDGYFGRSTVENRFAGADRELQLERMFSRKHPEGQHLATTVALWVWNLMVELGDELVEPEQIPPPAERSTEGEKPELEASESGGAKEQAALEGETVEASEPPAPITLDEEEAQLTESTQKRLADQGLRHRPGEGVVECSQGHYLLPTQAGKRDETHVTFRVVGWPCRGCPSRSDCTSSTQPEFRKTVTISNEEVGRAVEIRDSDRRAPIGVKPTAERVRAGPYEIRRPGFLSARRRRAFKEAAREAQLKVRVESPDGHRLASHAEQYNRRRRTRQRLPEGMRRRYWRLSPETKVRITWSRGSELAELVG